MKKTILMLVLAALSLTTYAATKVDKDLAIEYLKLAKFEDVINTSLQQYEVQLFASAKAEDKVAFHEMMVKSMGWEATKDQLATVVMNLYTKQEIDASIAFMKSPAGASATAKGGEFASQYAKLVSANMQKVLAQCCAPKK